VARWLRYWLSTCTTIRPSTARSYAHHVEHEAVPRGVVGFEGLILDAYAPLSIAAMVSVWLVGLSWAMEPSDR
jgi:hypothetical protein